MHQAQAADQLPPEHVHFVVEENEMHLHEDEDDLQTGPEDVEHIPAGDELVAVETKSKQAAHLNTNVNDRPDSEH